MPRWLWTRALPGLAFLVSGVAAYPVVRGHTTPALAEMETAKRALADARHAGAATWAPDALDAAESAFRAASAEHRRQQVRFLSLRDFRAVRDSLQLAEELCREATEEAKVRRRSTESDAAAVYKEAGNAVAAAAEFANAMPLGRKERAAFQKAEIALREAKIHLGKRDYRAALASARRAQSLAHEATEKAADSVARYNDPAHLETWRGWIEETVAWSRANDSTAIVVDKDGHTLSLYSAGRLVKTYDAELSENWTADKKRSGDWATPEGRYRVSAKKDRGASKYHRALLIDYPNAEDRAAFARAKQRGEIPRNATPGGLIEIHGDGGRGRDWTQGCVALRNGDMDEVFAKAAVGTRVTIVGSDGHGGAVGALVERHRRARAAG